MNQISSAPLQHFSAFIFRAGAEYDCQNKNRYSCTWSYLFS